MPDRLPNSPAQIPTTTRPVEDSPVESHPAVLAGKSLLEKVNAQVFAPELNKFRPNKSFVCEAELKRATVFSFMKNADFTRLANQTQSALQEAAFLDIPGKPELMNQNTRNHCMKEWGFASTPRDADGLDPDLYELYQIGLPDLAKAVTVFRELRTQSSDVDSQSKGEIRQVLRSLFAHGLTVCKPGVIQNIEDTWKVVVNAVSPPDLIGEFKKRTSEAALGVLSKHVYQRLSNQENFANNQVHMVVALKNALAGKYGLEKTEDKYASPDYAAFILGPNGDGLNAELDEATAPQVLFRDLAGDLMQQVWNRFRAADLEETYQ